MATCEICGRTGKKLSKYNIEGATVRACQECGKFGTKIKEEKNKSVPSRYKKRQKQSRSIPTTSKASREARKQKFRNRSKSEKTEQVLKGNFGEIIRKARLKENMTREDLAKELNEKESLLARIESGNFHPDKRLIDKLERRLIIKLTEKVSSASPEEFFTDSKSGGLTLGDVVKIKKKKKD